MTREQKANIDRLVWIWLSGLQSVTADAGWEGMSLAARLIEFKGQPPGPTGNDQSNMAMINAIRLLRRRHAEYPFIATAMSLLLKCKETQPMALAIAAKNFYQGICPFTDKAWNDANRAEMIGMTHEQYRWNLGKAYAAIDRELERTKIFSQFIA